MLTGRRRSAGDDAVGHARRDPRREPDWTALPADAAARDARCSSAVSRRIAGAESGTSATCARTWTTRSTRPLVRASPRRLHRARGSGPPCPWILALAGVSAAAATAFWPRWEDPLAGAQFVRLTGFSGAETDPAISADGKFVAFLSDRSGPFHIYLTQIDSGRVHRPHTAATRRRAILRAVLAGVRNHGFMADGSQIWLSAGPKDSGRRFQLLPLLGGGSWRAFLAPGVDERRVVARWHSNRLQGLG